MSRKNETASERRERQANLDRMVFESLKAEHAGRVAALFDVDTEDGTHEALAAAADHSANMNTLRHCKVDGGPIGEIIRRAVAGAFIDGFRQGRASAPARTAKAVEQARLTFEQGASKKCWQ